MDLKLVQIVLFVWVLILTIAISWRLHYFIICFPCFLCIYKQNVTTLGNNLRLKNSDIVFFLQNISCKSDNLIIPNTWYHAARMHLSNIRTSHQFRTTYAAYVGDVCLLHFCVRMSFPLTNRCILLWYEYYYQNTQVPQLKWNAQNVCGVCIPLVNRHPITLTFSASEYLALRFALRKAKTRKSAFFDLVIAILPFK